MNNSDPIAERNALARQYRPRRNGNVWVAGTR